MTPSKQLAIVRCQDLPEPDTDEAPLLAALTRAGVAAQLVSWDDLDVDWSQFELVVLRAT